MTNYINDKHTRKCIITGQIVNIGQLIRFDYDKKNNQITLDLAKNKKGRGAYFIPTKKNWEEALKSKALNRAFRTSVSKETYEAIEAQIMEVLYEQEEQN
ncbi:YlxR family protein [Mycoplasma corogypsi]|uniref:YlxR family protein n=1 Tax=Mycoplasma corogypsi TaxID=2106 RepID=UPI003873A4B3